MMPPKLGILAGGGNLPRLIVDMCQATGRPYFVIAFEGQTKPETVADTPHAWVRLGAAGTALEHLRANGVQDLVMAGPVKRPKMRDLRPDRWATSFLARCGASALGDGALLAAIVRELEEREGFRMVGAESLVPETLATEEVYGAVHPDAQALADIQHGIAAAREVGATDVGQGAVVGGGRVLALEDETGTDAMLGRLAATRGGAEAGAGDATATGGGRVGVLVKVQKPGQESRADLPTIGIPTVHNAAKAGLAGIAIEAGGALILDRAGVTAAADRAGLFVMGVPVPEDRWTVAAGAPRVFVVAGEPSGDVLASRLMAALKRKTDGQIAFAGVGGPLMEAQGLKSLFPISELSVMGLTEVLPHLPNLIRRLRETADEIRRFQPTTVITVDSSGFTWRLVKRLRRAGGTDAKFIHYVAPQVWAWDRGKTRRAVKLFDHLMTLLPFEPGYFEAQGLACTFVGHPVVEIGADAGDGPGFRSRHKIGQGTPLIAALPGSRRVESARLMPVFAAALGSLKARHPDLQVVVPAVAALREAIAKAVADWPVPALVVSGETEKFDAFAAADAALAASGTVSLELALAGTPTVIAYKVSPLTGWLAKRMLRVSHVNLVNILLDRGVIPEFLQERCTAENLASALETLISDADAVTAQRAAFAEALAKLRPGADLPSERAADVVLKVIGARTEVPLSRGL